MCMSGEGGGEGKHDKRKQHVCLCVVYVRETEIAKERKRERISTRAGEREGGQ